MTAARIVIVVFAVSAIIAAMIAACSDRAGAHEAASGWSYPSSCCSGRDCSEIPADWVLETPAGYQLVPTGEVIAYGDKRIKNPPDGRYHWCRPPGVTSPETICLFVPQGGV